MKLHIKNMVCNRCKYVVSNILDELDIKHLSVSLGVIDFGEYHLCDSKTGVLTNKFESVGFEIIHNKKSKLIEKIKTSVIELVSSQHEFNKLRLSTYLNKKLNHDYKYLSNLFSSVEGLTIEQYLINHKVEKIKELIVYEELNLTEISQLMGYSSLSHLSNQFKKNTGLSPSHFKRLRNERLRKSIG
ncbi:MAG: AraC family transcriptional regulator [Proteobacteria bacterium]|nr:AraC family transcriptional regulator [Pseudomonadota bacterium]